MRKLKKKKTDAQFGIINLRQKALMPINMQKNISMTSTLSNKVKLKTPMSVFKNLKS